MGLPVARTSYTITKLANAAAGNPGDNQRDLLLQVKNALVASGQWSVSRSSNGLSVVTGDNWIVPASLAVGSWVQLKNAAQGWEWLIYVTVSGAGPTGWVEVQLWVSGAVGFSGGTPTVAPTASDSFRINTFGVFAGTNPVASVQFKAFTWVSSDGANTRVAWWYQGKLTGFWQIEKVFSPVGGSWTPVAGVWFSSGNDALGGGSVRKLTTANYINGVETEVKAKTPAGVVEAILPTLEKGASNIPIADAYGQNEATLEYLWQEPVGLQVWGVGSPRNGSIGWLSDLWWGPLNAARTAPAFNDGDTADSGRFIFLGQAMLPWDETLNPPHGGAATTDRASTVFYGRDCGGGGGGGGCECDGDPDDCNEATATLGQMVAGAQDLADRKDDASISTARWNAWVNEGKDDLWRKIVAATGDSSMETHDFTLAGGAAGNTFDVTTIPARDFGRLTLLEIDPGTANRRRVRPFKFVDKDRLSGLPSNLPVYDDSRRYRRKGNVIYVERYEIAAGNYRAYYVPKVPDLVGVCDALPDYLDEWKEYPQVFAAMKALGKEESDPGYLPTRLAELRADIKLLKGEPDDDPDADGIADVEDMGGEGWD